MLFLGRRALTLSIIRSLLRAVTAMRPCFASALDADHVREDRGIELERHQSVNDFDKCGYDDPRRKTRQHHLFNMRNVVASLWAPATDRNAFVNRTNDGSARIVQTG
jgi:hypothetical protein